MPHDVFISYSSIDKAAAFAACATFEGAGIRCWIAPRDVAAGAEWAEEIITAIEAARIMVLIFSSNSNESRQVKREIELAVSRGLTIMPLRLEQVEPTRSMAYYMAGVHWIDAISPPLEQHFRKMVEWIKPHLGDRPSPEPMFKTRAEPQAAPPPPLKAGGETRRSGGFFDRLFGNGGAAPKAAPTPQSAASGVDLPRAGTPLPEIVGLKPEQDTLSGLFDLGLSLGREGKYEASILAYRRLIAAFDADDRPLFREQAINAFYNAGNMLRALGRHEEALAWFDAALERARGRQEEGIRETVARALFNKADSLDKLGRGAGALGIYDEVILRYGDDIDGVGRQLAGRSVHAKAVISAAMGRHDEAIALYDKYLAQNASDPSQQLWVVEAMYNSGVSHGNKGRNAEAVTAYDRVIQYFRGNTDPALNEYVAMSLYNKGNRLSDLKRPADAVKSYDELIATFGDDPRMPDRIAKGMINRANQLGLMGKRKEANAGYQAVIDKFATSKDAGVQQQVTNARNWKS